jgi:hypothetical protein
VTRAASPFSIDFPYSSLRLLAQNGLLGSGYDYRMTEEEKSEAARLLGRLGGKKGGKAHAEKLSPERRKEIARKAAKARWKKKRREEESS